MTNKTNPSARAPEKPISNEDIKPAQLKRVVGLGGATVLGLGSIVGTGVFVSLTMVAELAGPWTLMAIAVAGILAICNGLSSAQLAAAHPVSGGTYEYGYRYLSPTAGFIAGWMFLIAKSASAATAALGVAFCIEGFLGDTLIPTPVIGAVLALLLTAFVLGGLKRSTKLNLVLVSLTILSLGVFVVFAAPDSKPSITDVSATRFNGAQFFEACALAFVAFTGYGRVATMGEEIRHPERNIPLAVIATLVVTTGIYLAVGWRLQGTSDIRSLTEFEAIARSKSLQLVVTTGASLAMLGVLLNLILGLSRMLLAMARRADMPQMLCQLNAAEESPNRCVLVIGLSISGLCFLGDVKTTWSLSAFTVLVYYATANLCAIKQPKNEQLYPRFVSVIGFIVCVCLACWVDRQSWITGLALIAIGLLIRTVFHRLVARGVRSE